MPPSCTCQAHKRYGGIIPAAGSTKHPLKKRKYPAQLGDVRNDMPQAEAKKFLPPDCSIWRDNLRGAWMVHQKGHRRHTESFKNHAGDSSGAMRAAVRWVWKQYLEDNCLPEADCPLKDILPL